MTPLTPAGRYAPSPSGDLHLGNLRTALLAWLFARGSGRRFVLRIENLDRARDAGAAAGQLRDLAELGLDWDEPPLLQTTRGEAYAAAIAQLHDAGYTYPCFCSRADVQQAPSAPHTPPGFYPGTCRDLAESERQARLAAIHPRRPALRLRVPADLTQVSFDDRLAGYSAGAVDDFVLRRGDGTIAYNLAVVVDDAFQGVNQIVRGDDLLASTARQIVLQRLLGLATPPQVEYAHVPLVLNLAGKRLQKRDGAVTFAQLRQAGATAGAVRGQLAASLGLGAAGEQPSARTLLERFDPARLPAAAWVWQHS